MIDISTISNDFTEIDFSVNKIRNGIYPEIYDKEECLVVIQHNVQRIVTPMQIFRSYINVETRKTYTIVFEDDYLNNVINIRLKESR